MSKADRIDTILWQQSQRRFLRHLRDVLVTLAAFIYVAGKFIEAVNGLWEKFT